MSVGGSVSAGLNQRDPTRPYATLDAPKRIYQLRHRIGLKAVGDEQGMTSLSRATWGSCSALPSPKMMRDALANSKCMLVLSPRLLFINLAARESRRLVTLYERV